MVYSVTHATRYIYDGVVSLSHHLLRLQPRDLPRQHCDGTSFQIEPRPDVLTSHQDYFGNAVTFVTIEGSHKKLIVISRSRVEVLSPILPPPETTTPWDAADLFAADEKLADATREFIYDSPMIRVLPEFATYASASFLSGRPILAAVVDLTARMYKDFKFDSSATNIATPLKEVFEKRRGVCQDFAQLQIAFLRSMGVAARYVSGYLETDPPPGKPRLAGADASHAWVSFHCPGAGWIDVDPTNNLLVGNRHLTLAWGRDFSDVSPVRGIIIGSGDHELEVGVDVVRMPDAEVQEKELLLSPKRA